MYDWKYEYAYKNKKFKPKHIIMSCYIWFGSDLYTHCFNTKCRKKRCEDYLRLEHRSDVFVDDKILDKHALSFEWVLNLQAWVASISSVVHTPWHNFNGASCGVADY